MNQLNFYKYATYFLFIINVLILLFFFFGRPRPINPSKTGFINEATRMMDLNEDQIKSFKESSIRHHQGIRKVKRKQNKILKPYFNNIYKNNKSLDNDSLFNLIKELEGDKIKITEVHFKEVENMLDEKQKPKFKHFMDRAIKIILNNENHAPPRKMNKE